MILVDPLQDYPHAAIQAGARKHGVSWCHLVSDTGLAELHTFAQRIGLLRRWCQNDHYDLTPKLRQRAVQHGAIEVSVRELVLRRVHI